MFAVLSKDIDDPELRSFCLLNTAMIMARMGDYDIAATYLDIVIQLDTASLVTPFLTGMVAYELRDYPKAECCFEICLHDLNQERIDHGDDRLRFVLSRAMVRYNIRQTLNAQFSRHGIPYPIHGIPSEIIFEAPKRVDEAPESMDRPQWRRPANIGLPNIVRRKSTQTASYKRNWKLFPTPKRTKSLRNWWSLSSARTSRPGISSTSENLNPQSNREALPSAKRYLESRSAAPFPGKSLKPVENSWQNRPKTPHVARNPRVADDTTSELVEVFKHGPPRSQVQCMTPRHPQGEYPSLEELKKVFWEYAPDIEHSLTPHPCDLELEPRLSQRLNDKYDRATNVNVRNDSAICNSPASQRAMETLPHPHDSSIQSPAANFEPKSLEILQPAVYRPSKCVANVMPSGRDRDRDNGAWPAYHADSRIDHRVHLTNDSSSEEHILRQRDLALQARESKIAIKSTPCSSRISEPPSPVSTERFFEKVMSMKRRA